MWRKLRLSSDKYFRPRPSELSWSQSLSLVMPVGAVGGSQSLVRERRDPSGGFSREALGVVRFVPLIGEEGWG